MTFALFVLMCGLGMLTIGYWRKNGFSKKAYFVVGLAQLAWFHQISVNLTREQALQDQRAVMDEKQPSMKNDRPACDSYEAQLERRELENKVDHYQTMLEDALLAINRGDRRLGMGIVLLDLPDDFPTENLRHACANSPDMRSLVEPFIKSGDIKRGQKPVWDALIDCAYGERGMGFFQPKAPQTL